MTITKFTKINLNNFLKEINNKQQTVTLAILVDVKNFNKTAKIIGKNERISALKSQIPSSKWFTTYYKLKKVFIIIDRFDDIGFDFINILDDKEYIKNFLFYELDNNKKNIDVLKYYFDDNIFDI